MVDIFRGLCLAAFVVVLFIIISSNSAFAEKGSIVCKTINDPQYDFILDCFDTINVKTSTLDQIYKDFNSFSKSFEDAKVYKIREEGSFTYATLEIPLQITIKSDIRFSSSTNYVLEFIDGHLRGSKLTISLEKSGGFYDGTKDGASKVNFYFQIKNKPCTFLGFLCANPSHFEFALDRGLELIEPEAKKLQEKIDAQKKADEKIKLSSTTKTTPTKTTPTKITPTKTTTEIKPKVETELRGPPIVDFDGDGISDRFDNCKFDKETYNGYLDLDGCPDKVPQPVKQKLIIKDWDKDGIPDEYDICKKQPEVYNGYIDWDGCPDTAEGQIEVILDDDNDGILNHLDQCPNMQEVYNGFKDNDGCPDTILGNPKNLKFIQNDDSSKLPYWVKNNAKWWSEGSISDDDFLSGIKYMVEENIVKISDTTPKSKSSASVDEIPYWIKKSAEWWSDGLIDEDEFIRNIQYLISNGIIEVY